eukprot:CAMPEP_0194673154 /NCGR_PEP_ID=MMETSP0295-20121207/6884_1 /TAXON_ID=39354 /ORGANISM="Heterosigma akashiwo, Strain CCMP2393" /LENGTH=235 /DNA_ID=CAMNT_0039557025 /DNA_START=55 /DNA_END=759 /DNA_ORIENTATION=+
MWKLLGNSSDGIEFQASKNAAKQKVQPMLCGRYEVGAVVKNGITGVLYSGVLKKPSARGILKNNEKVVLKTEASHSPKQQLLIEWQVYTALGELTKESGRSPFPPTVGGVPRAELDRGRMPPGAGDVGEDTRVLAMEALGPNLMTLMQAAPGRRLSGRTVARLGRQATALLRGLHAAGFVHRDMKPENFVIGTGEQDGLLYLIDFGCAQRYRHPETNEIIPQVDVAKVGEGKRFP